MNTEFRYYKDRHLTTCVIHYKDCSFYGEAVCMPVDYDMESEITGSYIAETRAKIAVYKFIRDHELKPAIAALRHVQSHCIQLRHFNEWDREYRIICRNLWAKEDELTAVKEQIKDLRHTLNQYISGKDKIYQKYRSMDKNN